jgi:hypothetical protein
MLPSDTFREKAVRGLARLGPGLPTASSYLLLNYQLPRLSATSSRNHVCFATRSQYILQ